MLPIHDAANAYRKGRSIFINARAHATSRFLLRMDLTDFFPSITLADVVNYIHERPALFAGWTTTDMLDFSLLVSRRSALTIGAPTSPALLNALCYDMDAQVDAFCARSQIRYTRYADDLFFSTDQPGVLRFLETDVPDLLSKLKVPSGLKVNVKKTRHSSKRSARRVTGITLGSDGKLYIGRAFKRRIRALIHQLDSLDGPKRASLAGMITYARGFDPQFMNSLITKYGPERVRSAASQGPVIAHPAHKLGGNPTDDATPLQ